MKLLILIALATLTGCASDTAILRIIEYKAGTGLAAGADGIAVHQTPGKAFATVTIDYQGERGTVHIESSP